MKLIIEMDDFNCKIGKWRFFVVYAGEKKVDTNTIYGWHNKE